jgi:hypothetical protein
MEIQTYRPRINTVYFAIAISLLMLFVAQAFLYLGNQEGFSALFWSIAVGLPIYYGFIQSKIKFSESALTLVNPFSTIQIPWQEVESLDDKLNFTVTHQGKSYSAWIAPSKRKNMRRGFYRIDRIRDASTLTVKDFERREQERIANPATLMAREFHREFIRNSDASITEFTITIHKLRYIQIAVALLIGIALSII